MGLAGEGGSDHPLSQWDRPIRNRTASRNRHRCLGGHPGGRGRGRRGPCRGHGGNVRPDDRHPHRRRLRHLVPPSLVGVRARGGARVHRRPHRRGRNHRHPLGDRASPPLRSSRRRNPPRLPRPAGVPARAAGRTRAGATGAGASARTGTGRPTARPRSTTGSTRARARPAPDPRAHATACSVASTRMASAGPGGRTQSRSAHRPSAPAGSGGGAWLRAAAGRRLGCLGASSRGSRRCPTRANAVALHRAPRGTARPSRRGFTRTWSGPTRRYVPRAPRPGHRLGARVRRPSPGGGDPESHDRPAPCHSARSLRPRPAPSAAPTRVESRGCRIT
jgi:hypothetical protein